MMDTLRGRTLVSRSVILAVFAWLAGCRVGPNYHAPPAPDGAQAPLTSVDATIESTDAPPDAWWRLYQDPRLDGLIQEALRANRTLASAEANLTAARAVVSGARANRYPSTSIEGAGVYGRDAVTDEILEIDGHRPETIWLFEDLFQAAYEVDLFGRVRRAIEAANANADAAVAARDSVRVEVVAQTARSYAAICALVAEVDVVRHSLDVVTHEAQITASRQEAGADSQFDVTRAEALVSQVRATLAPLEGARRSALFELTALLGRTPAQAPHELESCVAIPGLVSLLPAGDGVTLLRRRPDVRQAERRLAAATAQIGVATADLYPTIHLLGLYGGAATEVPQLGTNLGLTWGLGSTISWNFPNQAAPRARIRQAKATQSAALATFDGVVLTALKETEQALTAYSAGLNNRQALGEARDQIHAAFNIAHDQYLAGAVSNLDLLTTEQTMVAVDMAVATADASLVQDQIAVFKALGGGWRRDDAGN
jgi:NodT family efflux transporter outer membrane factor (OMF) lipoprotein